VDKETWDFFAAKIRCMASAELNMLQSFINLRKPPSGGDSLPSSTGDISTPKRRANDQTGDT
jgi:hypothetical protein